MRTAALIAAMLCSLFLADDPDKKSKECTYVEHFDTSPEDKKCGDCEVKWCHEHLERNSKNGRGDTKGCLSIAPETNAGASFWYHFGSEAPISLQIEFYYSNRSGSKDFTPTDGFFEYKFSDVDDFKCAYASFVRVKDKPLQPNTDLGQVPQWDKSTFDVDVPNGKRAIYWRFTKDVPDNGSPISMLVDDVTVVPTFEGKARAAN